MTVHLAGPDPRPALGRRGDRHAGRDRVWLPLGALGVAALLVLSLSVGGYDIRLSDLWHGGEAREMFLISRVPRTVALVLAAAAMGVSGTVLQMITRNRFVEPTTTGSAQWSALVLTYAVAQWSTIAGLGPEVPANLGLNHDRVVVLGGAVVALATGATTVVVGLLPFVVLLSVALVVVCDSIGRTVVFPLEVPVSVVLGAVGATGFVALVLLSRRSLRA